MKCPQHGLELKAHGGPDPFYGQMYACPRCIFHRYEKEFRAEDPEGFRRAEDERNRVVEAGRQAYADKHGFGSFEEMKKAREHT